MSRFLGVDTSNYTTSAAVYDDARGEVVMKRKLLPVAEGQKGLRQSDALYAHVKALPKIMEDLFYESPGPLTAVGFSARPRDLEGSYMPCFEAGTAVARSVSAAAGICGYDFSHQAGHIAAALFSAGRLDLLAQPFIAFHVSGGTTEAVLCTPRNETAGFGTAGENGSGALFQTKIIAQSLDLKAGQAIDRVGLRLGLRFPAGPALEELAAKSTGSYRPRPSMKGHNCSLSGVENRCEAMIAAGEEPCDVARFCMDEILCTLDAMAELIMRDYNGLPLLFAGGVMSNGVLKKYFTDKYGALFAAPGYSADNAAGVAVMTGLRYKSQRGGS